MSFCETDQFGPKPFKESPARIRNGTSN